MLPNFEEIGKILAEAKKHRKKAKYVSLNKVVEDFLAKNNITEDAEFEIVEPKRIEDKKEENNSPTV